MKRLLVTGRSGFVGSTVATLLETSPALADWELAQVPEFDLRDGSAVSAAVRRSVPDAVLHLAAQSWVPEAFRDPESTLQVNVIGTLHLLQALREIAFVGPMLFASTGDVYGLVPETELPIHESRAPAPRNPYAVSKVAAEALCSQWVITEAMRVVTARAFNHIGAGQNERFVVSDFARQVVQIKLGQREPVVHAGDIDVTRDFTDARDVVTAYFALLTRGEPGEIYNICSGEERKIRTLLERLCELADVDVRIEQDSRRLRKSEQRRVCGDPGKIRDGTGWQATTPIDESLRSMLKYWEKELRHA